MKTTEPSTSLKDLQRIPGVGPAIAKKLLGLGIHSTAELQKQDPEMLYQRLCKQADRPVDRCVLYVFRSAVYFASHQQPDPELLKWWNWKNIE